MNATLYHLRYDFSDGETVISHDHPEETARSIWLAYVRKHETRGYTYVQMSETTGCLYREGSTINVTLEAS